MNMPEKSPASGDNPQPAGEVNEMQSREDCVSLGSLAMPDDESGDQMTTPEVGDRVSYQVEGKVTRIDGDKAYVKRESVNGTPVEASDESQADTPAEDQERTELTGMANQMGGM